MSTPFSDLLRAATWSGESLQAQVTPDWLQGRSAFGGLQSALAVQAMRRLVPPGLPLRALQTTFVAPVPAGPVSIRARLLRAGANVMHVQAELVDGETVQALVLGIFGAGRRSTVSEVPLQPELGDAATTEFHFVSGITPEFTRHFDARWRRGALPFRADPGNVAVVDLAMHDVPGTTASEAHVIALADFIPPVALSRLAAPAPGASLTWLLELLGDDHAGNALAGWRVDARLDAALDGYTSQSVVLWGPDGRARALSRQSMVVFG